MNMVVVLHLQGWLFLSGNSRTGMIVLQESVSTLPGLLKQWW